MKNKLKSIFKIEHWKIISLLMMCYDAVTIAASYFFALLIRFDFAYSRIPQTYLAIYLKSIIIYIVLCIC